MLCAPTGSARATAEAGNERRHRPVRRRGASATTPASQRCSSGPSRTPASATTATSGSNSSATAYLACRSPRRCSNAIQASRRASYRGGTTSSSLGRPAPKSDARLESRRSFASASKPARTALTRATMSSATSSRRSSALCSSRRGSKPRGASWWRPGPPISTARGAPPKHPKSALQELAAARGCRNPRL